MNVRILFELIAFFESRWIEYFFTKIFNRAQLVKKNRKRLLVEKCLETFYEGR